MGTHGASACTAAWKGEGGEDEGMVDAGMNVCRAQGLFTVGSVGVSYGGPPFGTAPGRGSCPGSARDLVRDDTHREADHFSAPDVKGLRPLS